MAMRARDLFGVALRILGAWFLVQGFIYAFFALLKTAGVATASQIPNTEDKLFSAFYFGLGIILIACAREFTSVVYGRENVTGGVIEPSQNKESS
jgi:hypothetical protein